MLILNVMKSEKNKPKQSYRSKKICEAVERVWAKEMDRRRKLGLPIIVYKDGKIIDLNPQPVKTDNKKIKKT